MIEVICNDRLGKKIRVKCNEDDTIGDLKKLVAAQSGTRPEKIRIQKWYTIFKDHITLEDYEIHDGMGLELYCARMLRCFLFCFLHSSLFLLLSSLSCCVAQTIDFSGRASSPRPALYVLYVSRPPGLHVPVCSESMSVCVRAERAAERLEERSVPSARRQFYIVKMTHVQRKRTTLDTT